MMDNMSLSLFLPGMGGAAIAPPSSLVDRDGKSYDPLKLCFKRQQSKYTVMAAEKEEGLMA